MLVKRTRSRQERDAYVSSLQSLGAQVQIASEAESTEAQDAGVEWDGIEELGSDALEVESVQETGAEWDGIEELGSDALEADLDDLFESDPGARVAHERSAKPPPVPLPLPGPGDLPPLPEGETSEGELELDEQAPGLARHRWAAPARDAAVATVGALGHHELPDPPMAPKTPSAAPIELPSLPSTTSQPVVQPSIPVASRERTFVTGARNSGLDGLSPAEADRETSPSRPRTSMRARSRGDNTRTGTKTKRPRARRTEPSDKLGETAAGPAKPVLAFGLAMAGMLALGAFALAGDSVLFGNATATGTWVQGLCAYAVVAGFLAAGGRCSLAVQAVALSLGLVSAQVANARLRPRIESVHEGAQGGPVSGQATLQASGGATIKLPLLTLSFVQRELVHLGRTLPVRQLYLGSKQDGDAQLRVFGRFPRVRGLRDLVHKELPIAAVDFNGDTPSLVQVPEFEDPGEVIQGRLELIEATPRGAKHGGLRVVGRIFMNVQTSSGIRAVSGRFEGEAIWRTE
ncbi:MAG: hypothetical protein OXR73_02360 [Myxococcales bacterium]|nr:hypothetical protein [Myxococcales bacterium]